MEAYEKASMWENDNYDSAKPSATPQLTTTTSYYAELNEEDNGNETFSMHAESTASSAISDSTIAFANVRAAKSGSERAHCKLCGKYGHVATSCPFIEIGKKAVKASKKTSHVAIVSADDPFKLSLKVSDADDVDTYHPCNTDILLDNGSQEHIFVNKNLLNNHETVDHTISIQGQVSEASFATNKVGYLDGLEQRIYYSDQAKANLLSYRLLYQTYKIEWDQEEQQFTVFLSDKLVMNFHLINSLYICDTTKDILNVKESYIAKVELNKSFFVPKEVASAEVANDLMKKLA
jgi:hypothetical protein